jgi:hypothetical protein
MEDPMDDEDNVVHLTDAMPCVCGSDNIINDLYDDELIYWCSHCGRQVIYEDQEVSDESSVS